MSDATSGESRHLTEREPCCRFHNENCRDIEEACCRFCPTWTRYRRPPCDRQRHTIARGTVCACGSTHEWERSKHGYCSCGDARCARVHGTDLSRVRP